MRALVSRTTSRSQANRPLRVALGGALILCTLGTCSSPEEAASPSTTRSPRTTQAHHAPGSFTVEHSIEYATAEVRSPAHDRAPLLLDLYRPAEVSDPAPVVVVIHGGGFAKQSRTDGGVVKVCEGLAGLGIAAASIDYRLLPQEPVPSERVQPLIDALPDTEFSRAVVAAVDDTLAAIAYLDRHADDLGLDLDRLGLVGSSAGAITADHVAYALDDHGITGPSVTFVGSLWGGILVAPPPAEGVVSAVQLDRGEAALFAVHGDNDRIVPVTSSDTLAARAEATGVPVEYRRIDGAAHGYGGSGFFTTPVEGDQTSYDRLLAFAGEVLG